MIDNIEHSVKNTLDYVGHAAQEVVRAKDSQKATVKVKNFILIQKKIIGK
jgi:hypothetical protein